MFDPYPSSKKMQNLLHMHVGFTLIQLILFENGLFEKEKHKKLQNLLHCAIQHDRLSAPERCGMMKRGNK